MSKPATRKRGHTRAPTLSPHPARPTPLVRRIGNSLATWWARLLTVVFAVAAIASIFGALIFLPPHVHVSEPENFFEPADPFSSSFFINNQGYFSIYSVSAVCENERDVFSDTNTQAYGNRVIHDVEILEIRATERAPWQCGIGISNLKSSLQEAHLRVDVSFRPAILFWIHHVDQEFDALKNSEGKWFWFPRVEGKSK